MQLCSIHEIYCVDDTISSRAGNINDRCFSFKDRNKKKLSPATIVEGKEKLNMGVKRIPFGAYSMVCTGTSNIMKIRSVPGIALKPSNNDGGQYFMFLYSGKRIHSYIWEDLPIDEGLIHRVE